MKKRYVFIVLIFFICVISLHADEMAAVVFFISDAVNAAKTTHPSVIAAKSRMAIYGEILHRANMSFLPDFNLGLKYDRLSYLTQQKDRFLDTPDDFQAFATVRIPLFTGFKNLSERNAAILYYEASKQDLKAAEATAVYEARSLYFNALYYRNVLKNKEELLNRAKLFYADSETLNKRTNIPRNEQLLRIKVLVNSFLADVISAKQKYEATLKALCFYCGFTENKMPVLSDYGTDISVSLDDNFDIAQSPYYLSSEKKMEALREKQKAAVSFFYPSLSAYYTYKYEWSQLPGGGNDYIFGLSLDLPFFDWGITGSKVSESEKATKEGEAAADNIRLILKTKYETVFSGYKAEVEKLSIYMENLENAKKSLKIYEKRYKSALCSSDELLDAQKLYSTAHNDYENSLLAQRLFAAEIKRIKGE